MFFVAIHKKAPSSMWDFHMTIDFLIITFAAALGIQLDTAIKMFPTYTATLVSS